LEFFVEAILSYVLVKYSEFFHLGLCRDEVPENAESAQMAAPTWSVRAAN
jgi:hypothetical protein